MALSDITLSYIRSSKLFKKSVGKTETTTGRTFYEENINTYNYVPTTSVWLDYNSIPNNSPVLSSYGISGVVQYISGFTLTPVPGLSNSFYDSGNTFKDIIPFNFTIGTGTTYNYTITDSIGTAIAFGQGDWLLDTEAGVLTFYNTVPANMPPKISFYKYVGAKTVSDIFLSAAYNTSDTYVASYNLNALSSNLLYVVNFLSGNTPKEKRAIIKKQMEDTSGNIKILVASFGTSATGINIKAIVNLVFADSFKSDQVIRQAIGRVLRLHSTKENAIIFDLVDQFHHDFKGILFNHFQSRKKDIYEKQQYPYEELKFSLAA